MNKSYFMDGLIKYLKYLEEQQEQDGGWEVKYLFYPNIPPVTMFDLRDVPTLQVLRAEAEAQYTTARSEEVSESLARLENEIVEVEDEGAEIKRYLKKAKEDLKNMEKKHAANVVKQINLKNKYNTIKKQIEMFNGGA